MTYLDQYDKAISIPCNGCMDNTRCPRVNPFLWFVFLSSTLDSFNYMKQLIQFIYIIIDIDIPYLYSVGIQTKGKFACSFCGPKIKYRRSKRLRKEVFDEYMNFLSKNHTYRTNKKNIFDGKQETALKTWRMTRHLWKMQYKRNHQTGTYVSSYINCYVF